MASKIKLYSYDVPNGWKISIALEEMELDYEPHFVDIKKNEQFTPEFIAINPYSKIPAIVDPCGPVGDAMVEDLYFNLQIVQSCYNHRGKPINMMESCAILLYLAEKSGKFMSNNPRFRLETIQWLSFQVGEIAPTIGQFYYFLVGAQTCQDPYPTERYLKEGRRLLAVVERRLDGRDFLIDDGYSIADMAIFPWIIALQNHPPAAKKLQLDDYPLIMNWKARCMKRSATTRGMNMCKRPVVINV